MGKPGYFNNKLPSDHILEQVEKVTYVEIEQLLRAPKVEQAAQPTSLRVGSF